jgi:hypothetical protein
MQANTILSSGLRNPKCMAALQLMQQSPEEAKRKFGNDPDVNAFLMEFGKVMSDHFNSLGAQTGPDNKVQRVSVPEGPRIVEVSQNGQVQSSQNLGPLAKVAVDRNAR